MTITWGKLILFLLAICCFLLVAINCGGYAWSVKEVKGFKYQYGLWKFCVSSNDTMKCASYTGNIPSWMNGVRALTIISALVLGVVLCITFISFFFEDKVTSNWGWIFSAYILAIAFFVTGSLTAIAMKVYTDHGPSLSADYGWTYFLGFASCASSYLTCGLIILLIKYTNIDFN